MRRSFVLACIITPLAGCAPATQQAPVPVAAPSPVATPAAPPPAAIPTPSAPVTGPVALCGRGTVQRTADGRLFHHFPYPDTPASTLIDAPPALGASCKVHPALLPDLTRLLAAADADPAVAGTVRAVSCHRSVALQQLTFCGGIGPDGSGSFAERAWASAPPGFSEHSTGYVIDFGSASAPACDADACFGATPAGRWLRANAARFGFEMSFPAGNKQQVKWEPWHWRWVGTAASEASAAPARTMFATVRTRFPAEPKVD